MCLHTGVRRCAIALLPLLAFAAGTKELRFAIPGDPKSFDPLHVEESNSQTVQYLTAGVLVKVNRATDKPEPELAESWEVKDGGRAITFRLRAGLKFSDGTPLTSGDVARTLNRALDPKEGSPAGDTFRSADGIPEVREGGPRDITIRYKLPKAGLDRLFDQLGIAPASPGKLPASAGPFYVSEYRRGDYIRLTRNPNYWKKDSAGQRLPYIESIRVDIQQNHDIELVRFLRGESQLIARLDPESFDRVAKEKPAAARNLGASLDSEFLWFNQAPAKTLPDWKRRWFTSTAFRHAISAAIHRDDLARIVYRGHAHPAMGPISPANRFWFNSSLKARQADPQGAVKSLAAEGFVLRNGVLRDRDGHAVEFSIVTNSGNKPRERMSQLIQDDLGKIGIRVNLVPLDFGSLIERISKTLDYEAAILGFSNVAVDPLEEMNFWLSSGAQHPWWPAEKSPATPWEARIDQLELKQASESSRDVRRKAIDEMQRIVEDQEPVIYLVNPDYLCAIAPSVRGAQPVVVPPQIFWNVEWLRLE
ncbi:MAG TPA: ABC transporter substrate-binding protein [Bryobacteraceae bacterium]|nr:ABC transporter substrate-binding protein [Bryobacteraceae bacterium]